LTAASGTTSACASVPSVSATLTNSPGHSTWSAFANVARSLIVRHIETEHDEMFAELSRRFDAAALDEMGRRFQLAREKLTLLEDAKAA